MLTIHMVSTGNSLPKAMGHGGHGSLIAPTSYGSTETRYSGSGKMIDCYETVKGVSGRVKSFTP